MPEVTYRFTNAVERAIAAERTRLLRLRRLGLITSQQVTEMFESFLARHLYGARLEDNPDRAVGVKCPNCNGLHIVPVSVSHIQCKCAPSTDIITSLNRVPLN